MAPPKTVEAGPAAKRAIGHRMTPTCGLPRAIRHFSAIEGVVRTEKPLIRRSGQAM
jgi:hypothetical protein